MADDLWRQVCLDLVREAKRTGAKTLDLSRTALSSRLEQIGPLTWLRSARLALRRLRELPAEIGQLPDLQTLDLSHNQLRELPAEIGQLSQLRSLDLRFNQLKELPAEIGQLSQLQTLNLRNNQLRELPAEIGQLSQLQTLNLSNRVRDDPVFSLIEYASLRDPMNRLRELPADIGRLSRLQTLDLRNNQLRELPAEIGQLTRLETLDLANRVDSLVFPTNRLKELPAEIGRLSRLRTLDLRNNQLRKLPAEIGQLSQLETLSLRHNRLRDLPAEIGQLSRLQSLGLSVNRLTELPAEIGQLTRLETLSLLRNPRLELPAGIQRHQTRELLGYYRRACAEESRRLREARVSKERARRYRRVEPAERELFLSYAWRDESEEIADEIEEALADRDFRLVRDKRDLGFKGSIRGFMERIGEGRGVVLVISDKYLKSKHCMSELVAVFESGEFRSRIFPVVLDSARIDDSEDRLDYLAYWEEKAKRLEAKMRVVSLRNQQGIREDLDLYDKIRNMIARLTHELRDMNTLSAERHRTGGFAELIGAVERELGT